MGLKKEIAGVCAIVVAALLFSAIRSVGFASNSATQATLQTLQYLSSQQSATDGSIGESISQTAEFVTSAAVAGYDPNTLMNGGPSAVHYLQAVAATAASNAGNSGFLLQAAAAAGNDPTTFGGVDLVAQLNALYHPATAGKTLAGSYGSGEAFDQALALIGLKATHQSVPQAALDYLHAAQDSDSGWNYLASKDNPGGFGSDTNSTAIILMALDGAGDHTLDSAALTWLKTQQDSDGGFPYQAGYGSDPDSDALVLQALVGSGQDPGSAQWSQGGNTVVSNLLALQDASGGYAGYSGVGTFTSAQVPLGLERAPYPVDFSTTVYYTHGNGLPTPAPSATPTPSSTPTATATATATSPTPTPTVIGGLTPPISTTSPRPTATVQAARNTTSQVVSADTNPTPTGSVEGVATTPTPPPVPSATGAVQGIKTVTANQVRSDGSGSYWWAYVLALMVGIGLVAGAGAFVTTRNR